MMHGPKSGKREIVLVISEEKWSRSLVLLFILLNMALLATQLISFEQFGI